MTDHEKSAIIGHWRSGAAIEVISVLTGFPIMETQEVIEKYLHEIEGDKIIETLLN